MAEWGGKRTPRNPAPVSGPGRMSRRTDGGPQQTKAEMTGMGYGENADFQEIQAGAPLAAAPSATPARPRKGGSSAPSVTATPLFAPTQRPDEPITAGAPFGPGAGPAAAPSYRDANQQDMQKLKDYLPDLEVALNFENVPQTFRMLINYLRNA